MTSVFMAMVLSWLAGLVGLVGLVWSGLIWLVWSGWPGLVGLVWCSVKVSQSALSPPQGKVCPA